MGAVDAVTGAGAAPGAAATASRPVFWPQAVKAPDRPTAKAARAAIGERGAMNDSSEAAGVSDAGRIWRSPAVHAVLELRRRGERSRAVSLRLLLEQFRRARLGGQDRLKL